MLHQRHETTRTVLISLILTSCLFESCNYFANYSMSSPGEWRSLRNETDGRGPVVKQAKNLHFTLRLKNENWGMLLMWLDITNPDSIAAQISLGDLRVSDEKGPRGIQSVTVDGKLYDLDGKVPLSRGKTTHVLAVADLTWSDQRVWSDSVWFVFPRIVDEREQLLLPEDTLLWVRVPARRTVLDDHHP